MDGRQVSVFKYEELAQTLERIRDNGRAEFYEGETAKRIVTYVQELGGDSLSWGLEELSLSVAYSYYIQL